MISKDELIKLPQSAFDKANEQALTMAMSEIDKRVRKAYDNGEVYCYYNIGPFNFGVISRIKEELKAAGYRTTDIAAQDDGPMHQSEMLEISWR
jgi:hypothetical protein